MISKYLSDLGVKEEDLPWNWCSGDSREKQWKKQRDKYGFDERDTWGLDYTLILLIYPRLKMYNEINIIDTSFHKVEYEDKKYTYQECIDKILEGFEIYLTKNQLDLNKEEENKINDAVILLSKIWWLLWW